MTNVVDRTGLDGWAIFVKKEQAKKDKLEEAKDRPELREAEVVEAGHEIPLENLSKRTTVGQLGHLAAGYGWTVKAGESKYRTADRMYKGEIKLGEIKAFNWVQAISPNREHHISVSTDLFLIDGWPCDSKDEVKIHLMEYSEEN